MLITQVFEDCPKLSKYIKNYLQYFGKAHNCLFYVANTSSRVPMLIHSVKEIKSMVSLLVYTQPKKLFYVVLIYL